MSAQSAKKKRIGSRRQVVSQSITSEADEFHETDSTSVAQHHIPEENTGSLNSLPDPDDQQPEIQNPCSPEHKGSRRKLGSSRRNKGRQHVNEATESHHKSREEVEGKTTGNESHETIQMSQAVQPERQEELSHGAHDTVSMATTYDSDTQNSTTTNPEEVEKLESLIPKSEKLQVDRDEDEIHSEVESDSCKLVKTTLEGSDNSDTLPIEEVKGDLVSMELTSLSVHSHPTVDQQLIDQSNPTEIAEEQLSKVYSLTGKESKERDEGTVLLRQDGNLLGNYLVSESHVESVLPYFITPEITTDKSSPRKNTEHDSSVEQVTFSSPHEELSTYEEPNGILNLDEVSSAQLSEGVVDKIHEEEVKPTQMHEISHSFESLTPDATENSEIISVNLIEQAELNVKSTDNVAAKQEDLNCDDKQDEHPTKENHFKAFDPKNENYRVYETTAPQISDTEKVNTALGQVYEIESRVEDDITPSAEQKGHQEKNELFSEMEQSELSLQTLQSEIHAPLDSQTEENDTDFNPIGNRRKLGSSRRNRGRQHVTDSAAASYHRPIEDIAENVQGNEAFETAKMLLSFQTAAQKKSVETTLEAEVESDSSIAPEIQTDISGPVEHTDIECSMSVEQAAFSSQTEVLPRNEEQNVIFNLSVVKDAQHSEDDVNKVLEQEINPTQMHEINYFSQSGTHDVTGNDELISGNLIGRAGVSGTDQPQALDHKSQDYHVSDSEKPQISDIDSAVHQVCDNEGQLGDDIQPSAEQTVHQDKERILSEAEESKSSLQTLQSETNTHLDSEPQDNSQGIKEQTHTGFDPIGNRRKMGSSRRNKGRQKVNESVAESYHEHQEEDVESTSSNELLETTQILLTEERTSQEKLSQVSEHGIIMPATHDNSLFSAIMHGYSSEVQNPTTSNYPDLESLIPKSENLQEDYDERETDFTVEVSDKSEGATLGVMDKSDALQSHEVGALHSENAVNEVHEQELDPTQMQESDYSSESLTHDATENSEITSENPMDLVEFSDTYQSELIVQSTDDSASKQEDSNPDDTQDKHPTKENNFKVFDPKNENDHVYDITKPQISDTETVNTALGQVYEDEGRVEDDITPSPEQPGHQKKNELFSEMEESESSLQTLQSEIHAPLDSQPEQNDTDFNPIGNRRKLGSSRRNRGRQHVTDSAAASYHRPIEDIAENVRGNEAFETTKMLLSFQTAAQEKSVETTLEAGLGSDSSIAPEIQTDISGPVEHTDIECSMSAEQAAFSSQTEVLPRNEEQNVIFNLSVVKDAQHSEDDVNKVLEEEIKLTQIHEMNYFSQSGTHDVTGNDELISGNLIGRAGVSGTDQPQALDHKSQDYHVSDSEKPQISDIDSAVHQVCDNEGQLGDDIQPSAEQTVHQDKERILSEAEESKSSLQTLQSQTNTDLDSEPQDNSQGIKEQTHTSFNPIGHRRKMGSSRRNKGRQKVNESVAESYHEHQEEDVESTSSNELLETTQILLTEERTSQEKLSQVSEHDTIMPVTHDNSMFSAIMHGYSSEVQNPTTSNYPETDLESLIPKSETLQEDYDERQTDFTVKVSDKSEGASLGVMDKSDALQSHEVGALHSENAVNEVHEQELDPTQMQEIDYSSESLTHDATENSEIISENPIDLAEVSDTYQSELIVQSTDDSASKQEDSNPDDTQDKHPTKENNFKVFDPKNENDHAYDITKPQISDTETVNTALGQVYEDEGRVEDDITPSPEQPGHQKKNELFSEMEESESSLQTLQSEIHAPLDSQPEQIDTDFNPIGNRRKLGSSRKNRGRQHDRDSAAELYHRPTEEDLEKSRGNEPIQTTEMSLTIETVQEKSMETILEGMETCDTAQTEDVSDQVKENAHVDISEHASSSLLSSSTVDQQLINQSLSTEMAEDAVERKELYADEEEQEHVNVSLIREALQSEDVVNEVNKEVKATLLETNAPLEPLDNFQSIKEQTHTGFNPTGNRRKLGSSRRNKGRQQLKDSVTETNHEPKEESVEQTRIEDLETTKMSLAMEEMKQGELEEQTDLYLKPTDEVSKNKSTLNDEENTEKMPEEDTILSQIVMDNSVIATTDLTSNSGKDDFVKSSQDFNEEERKLSVWKDDSDVEHISYHDDNVTARSSTLDVLEREDTHQPQNTEALTCDKEINMQQTHEAIESVGHVTPHNTEAESAMDVQGENIEDPTKKEHEDQEMNASSESAHSEPLSAIPNKADSLAPFDVGLKENVRAEPAVDVSEESGISSAVDVCSSQQELQEKTHLDTSEGVQKQKRRKMGSTRRNQLNRKPEEGRDNKDETKESNFNITADVRNLDKMEVVEELPMSVTTTLPQDESAKPSLSPVSKEQETKESFVSLGETTQSTPNYEERPQRDDAKQKQALKSAEEPVVPVADLEIVKSVVRGGAEEEQKNAQALILDPNNVDEGAHNTNLEMKNASPDLNPTHRRRKMGSTRRNLISRTKEEDLHQKQEVNNEATQTAENVGDVKTEYFPGIKEKEQQLHVEHEDSDSKERVFETVEYSHTESHFAPVAHQTFEVNPVSHGQPVDTEHQLPPNDLPAIPSTPPKHDEISESASGGRRRKMGSHRKSRGHQNKEDQTARGDRITDTQSGRDVGSATDESAIKTTEDQSLGMDKISEVDESDKKTSSNISTSNAGQHSGPVSSETTPEQATPVQHRYAEIRLGDESQKALSSDDRSARFNVVMIGDSSVGKTSFMRRAQSGKFSLDLPASIGNDTCRWTVVVDGKPVVLQLWDTAGQERFRSITRQIFHKAQAFLLMYDITSSKSFSAVSYWASCIQEGAAENITVLLLGNKRDQAERQVKTQEGEALAKEYNFEFMECSAASGENVIQSLEAVARLLSQKVDTREEATVLLKGPQQKKSGGCC